MKLILLLPLFSLLSYVATQKVEGSLDSLVDEVFGPKNETKAEGVGIKCGEGEDKGIHKCVGYLDCYRHELADMKCDRQLEVCCEISENE